MGLDKGSVASKKREEGEGDSVVAQELSMEEEEIVRYLVDAVVVIVPMEVGEDGWRTEEGEEERRRR